MSLTFLYVPYSLDSGSAPGDVRLNTKEEEERRGRARKVHPKGFQTFVLIMAHTKAILWP